MRSALLTLLVTFVSGVFPLVNAEIYLAAVGSQIHHSQVPLQAVAAGLGQTLGKIVWYVAADRSLDVPVLRKRLQSGKVKAGLETWQARMENRPWAAAGLMFLSALVGAPPLLVTAVAAGLLKMRMWVFVTTIFVGRSIQSYVILAGLAVAFHGW